MMRVSRLLPLVVLALLLGLTIPLQAAEAKAKGKVKNVNSDKNEFVMGDQDGKNWTFHCDKDCKINLNGKESKLADLQADDMVEVTYSKQGEQLNAREVRCTRK
jgi:uncharacterized surface anchored protein